MQIAQLMTRPPSTCRPDESLHCAAQRMWERDCGVLPVVDEEGAVVGMVTDRDLCMAAWMQGRPMHEIPVRVAMSKRIFSCHAAETLQAAQRVMGLRQVRRVPVVDDDERLLGVLSLNDLARETIRTRQRNPAGEHDFVLAMATICEPRAEQRAPSAAAAPVPVDAR
jgi:CBS domain-containing protein